ncbi:MAG: helicase-related protein [Phototrophicaceae bacterium]
MRLEDLQPNMIVNGLMPAQAVTLISVQWSGENAVTVVYRHAQGLGEMILYREDEARLTLFVPEARWAFDVDGDTYKLVSEAYRIQLAHLFDPMLAVHTSQVEPLPHQIIAVYDEMLTRQPLRFLLADDPGAGKTVMAGLLIRELMLRGDVKRCLVCAPGSLTEQWQDELKKKFQLDFDILTPDMVEASHTGNPFNERDLLIVRLDMVARSRDEALQNKLKQSDWDLIICDEAHKMSASFAGGEIKETKRYKLAKVFGEVTRHLLLMTATPHNGYEENFQLFLALLDADRFEGKFRNGVHRVDASDLMRRMVKEKLLRFDGKPLFPERRAYTVNYSLSAEENALYESVTEYVRNEFNRADELEPDGRKGTVGFALTILQRRLASSSHAIYQSLKRRHERLEKRLKQMQQSRQRFLVTEREEKILGEDWDDLPADEEEQLEEKVMDGATAARTIEELEAEIKLLRQLEAQALQVKRNGNDRKWNELRQLLSDTEELKLFDHTSRKLVIFTEYRDTLEYLKDRLTLLFGQAEKIVVIHGGLNREARRKAEEDFRNDPETRILLATDAAGEGINLQRAHLMVNYDLPWNPNRLEQRFGRIHRIGQMEVCHLWNLVAVETREGEVYQRLLSKLQTERNALDGQVFDVLGSLFTDKPLRELLMEAVRYGDQPAIREKLFTSLDNLTDRQRVRNLLEQQSLLTGSMDVSRILELRAEMERASASRLQPFYIKAFFVRAFTELRGSIREHESGRYKITHVPADIRDYAKDRGLGVVSERYERVCFDKELIQHGDKPPAVFVCPGHPLLDATLRLLLDRQRDTLKHGGVFVDEGDMGTQVRALFYLEGAIQDALPTRAQEQRAISREVHFVEIMQDGTVRSGGGAPYLDYRAATADELKQEPVDKVLSQSRTSSLGWEQRATEYTITHLIQPHLKRVQARRLELLDKTEAAVIERLHKEITYWDIRAQDFADEEEQGKPNASQSKQQAKRRAEKLAERLRQRREQIAYQRQISPTPPLVVGGALILPLGLLMPEMTAEQHDKRVIEQLAMQAVMDEERRRGHEPIDVSQHNLGYDIESKDGQSRHLRFIEVKGRRADATTVSLTYNEVLCALNSPQQFILAVVLVEGATALPPQYIEGYPFKEPDHATVSINYAIKELLG